MKSKLTYKRWRQLLDRANKMDVTAEAYRKELAVNCTHPEEAMGKFTWEHDTGYGRQYQMTGDLCSICKRRWCYGRQSTSISEEDWYRRND